MKYFNKIFLSIIFLFFINCQEEFLKNSEKPNILLLLADDVGYGDMNFMGNNVFNTTNLNILSKKGTIFTQLYSPTPLCTPSRAGILTGRHPVRYGMAGNYSEDPNYATEGVLMCDAKFGLPHTEKTIAQYLNETGYDTYLIGKWHLGHKCDYLPHTFGFKEYYGVPYAISMGYFEEFSECHEPIAVIPKCPPMPLMHSSRSKNNNDTCEILKQPVKREELSDLLLKRFEENIDDSISQGNPFFMFMAFAQAHTDCRTKAFHSHPEFLQDNEYYRASVNEMDYMVGKITKMLNDKNIMNNTIIIFTSDNGARAFNPTIEDETISYQGSNGPFAGTYSVNIHDSYNTGKCSTWEGGMRVPGFMIWEGKTDVIKPSTYSYQIYSSMDLLPTVLNILNINVPDNLDGVNMLPNLYKSEISNRFLHYYRGGAFYALRYGKWKFHLFTRPGEDCGFFWYAFPQKFPPIEHKNLLIFDLNQDPGERNPIDVEWFNKYYSKIYEEVLNEIKNHRESMKNHGPNVLESYEPENKVCCDKAKNCDCRDKI